MKPGDIVCASKLDRMFRSAIDALACAEQMKAAGVDLVLVDIGADPVTDNGMAKCFFTMAAAFAELERNLIHERMTTGKLSKIAKGGHAGGEPPYGHRIIGRGREANIEVDEREQEIVQLVTRLRQRGDSISRIQRRLVKDGVKTRTGKDFHWVQVKRIVEHARNAC